MWPFQGVNSAYFYEIGTWSSVLIREVSLIQGCSLRGFHCTPSLSMWFEPWEWVLWDFFSTKYSKRLKKHYMKFANFVKYFTNKVNKAISSQLTSQRFMTVYSHVREHMYRLYYCSRRFPSCMRNPRKILNYTSNSFMNFCEVLCKASLVPRLPSLVRDVSGHPGNGAIVAKHITKVQEMNTGIV